MVVAIALGLDKISSFQDNEYKSKVFALVAQVKKISAFQSEILENEARLSKSELYGRDVQLISKNGKIYYLPTEECKAQNV